MAVAVLAVDQATKFLALRYLDEKVPLIGNYLFLKLVHNPGAALSLLSSHTWVFTIIGIVALVVIVYFVRQATSRAWALCLGALGGGALGNLIDRLFQPPALGQGHVVDFIGYGNWFVGNVADIAIVLAVVLMVYLTARGISLREES